MTTKVGIPPDVVCRSIRFLKSLHTGARYYVADTPHTKCERSADTQNGSRCHTKRSLSMTSSRLFIRWRTTRACPSLLLTMHLRYHKKISEYYQTFRGENRESILGGSIYISCRVNNNPRTPKEIASIFHLDVQNATRGCKNVQQIINVIEKDMDNTEKTVLSKTTPDDFIERYCSRLNMNQELTRLCHFISIKVEKSDHYARKYATFHCRRNYLFHYPIVWVYPSQNER